MVIGNGPLEVLVSGCRLPDANAWRGRSVLVTGHTGFKGGWMCHWLSLLGAEVHGLALDSPTDPSLFDVSRVASLLASDMRADIRDLDAVAQALTTVDPEIVFHMAAQPLVRESYTDPVGTFQTNVMGTIHVLEAIRACPSTRAAVIVTTDKVYRNREWVYPYRESDQIGGHDPYSASKSAAEIVTASYRRSFFTGRDAAAPKVVTARAGNVIGGGDWSVDRLLPDLLRAVEAGSPVNLRYPNASRPWQHVLDPVAGYVVLAERLLEDDGATLPQTWNFGPDVSSVVPVAGVVEVLGQSLGIEIPVHLDTTDAPPESQLLALDSSQAHAVLGWGPRWSFRESVERAVEWHAAWRAGEDMLSVTRNQIKDYTAGTAA